MTTVRTVPRGEYLFREHGPVRGFYVVLQGSIKLHRVFLSGHEQIIHIYQPGETLAEESLVSVAGHLADACAIEEAVVLTVRRQEFLALLVRRPQLALRVLESLDRQLQRIVRLLDDLTLKDVRTRVATYFLRRSQDPRGRDPERIELHVTKRLLASELGTTSETFSRTLAALRDEGLVELEQKAVVLLSPSRLAASIASGGATARLDPSAAQEAAMARGFLSTIPQPHPTHRPKLPRLLAG
jgi:CRP/FNR family transcriptional regulator